MLGVWLERRLPQPSQPCHAAVFFALEQVVQPLTENVREPVSQLLVDSAIGASDRLRVDTFDCIQAREEDRSLPERLDQARRKHDAFVRLHRCFSEFFDGKPVMACRERFKAEDRLKFDQALSPGLSPVAVLSPVLDRNLDLRRYKMKQWRKLQLIYPEHPARKTQVPKLST